MGQEYWQFKAFLQRAQWWDRHRIEAWQLERLREIVRYAYGHVPGYHLLYRDAGVRPADIVSLESIRLLPLTTKELLRDHVKDFTARDIAPRRLRYTATAGSTGIPFGFYQTASNWWMENAFMHSGWQRAGWQFGDASAVLRAFIGSEDRFWSYDPVWRELQLSSCHLTDRSYARYVEKIGHFRPKHLQAYPSSATILADLVLDHGDVGRVDFGTILLGSENIYNWQKKRLREAFPGARLFGWYGHSEQAVLAAWCEYTDRYHVWPFYGLAEVLGDKHREVDEGEVGEVVGTSFVSRATPFIRYCTMDLARKATSPCDRCGRRFAILDTIEGRLQEIIITGTGRYIPMAAINMHSDVFDSVRQFQFHQDMPGRVVLRVAPKVAYSDEDTAKIYRELRKKLGQDMELEIVFVDEIQRTARGKHRFLEQKLSIAYGE
jgi:phenylacetate-CoA ligase